MHLQPVVSPLDIPKSSTHSVKGQRSEPAESFLAFGEIGQRLPNLARMSHTSINLCFFYFFFYECYLFMRKSDFADVSSFFINIYSNLCSKICISFFSPPKPQLMKWLKLWTQFPFFLLFQVCPRNATLRLGLANFYVFMLFLFFKGQAQK